MKFRGILGALALATVLFSAHPSPARAVTRVSVNVDFYNALDPYGDWEYIPRYGDCWVPNRPASWRPYTVGYWVDTDYGWMWISQDPWGGMPYHYGRWGFDASYGWFWVPDDDLVWAPSWCAWRYGDDYVGWAPLPPDAGWGGSGLSISLAYIDRDIYRSGWCFTPTRSFGSRSVRYSILPPTRNVTLFARTRNVTSYGSYGSVPVVRGVQPAVISRATGQRFQRYHVADVSSGRPGRASFSGRNIQVYRPTIVGARRERARFAPRENVQNTRGRGGEVRQNQDRGAMQRANQNSEMRRQRDIRRRQNQDAEMRRQRQQDLRRQRQQQSDQYRQDQQQQRQYERRGRGPDQGGGGSRDQNQGRWQREQRPPQDQPQQPPPQQQRQRGGRDQGQQAPHQKQQQPNENRGRGRDQRDQRNRDQSQDQSDPNDQNKDQGHGRGHGG